jgi:predicted O-methyltransferase YrrM
MFHDIPEQVQDCMRDLEARDMVERGSDLPKFQRLRQIPPETGKFLSLLCLDAPKGMIVEVGTSGGYSGLWLALACRQRGDKLTTFEVAEDKVVMARETFRKAGVNSTINVVHGDVRSYISRFPPTAFCFIDAEKDVYVDCYEQIVPNLLPGGMLIANGALTQTDQLSTYLGRAYRDPRVDALVVPIGRGLLICRKI